MNRPDWDALTKDLTARLGTMGSLTPRGAGLVLHAEGLPETEVTPSPDFKLFWLRASLGTPPALHRASILDFISRYAGLGSNGAMSVQLEDGALFLLAECPLEKCDAEALEDLLVQFITQAAALSGRVTRTAGGAPEAETISAQDLMSGGLIRA